MVTPSILLSTLVLLVACGGDGPSQEERDAACARASTTLTPEDQTCGFYVGKQCFLGARDTACLCAGCSGTTCNTDARAPSQVFCE